ncbi:MAG: hypothetical protein CL712_00750 [Chloroflexi bacterium]|nr:hypothetical protein [Chloroflexota bacterium]
MKLKFIKNNFFFIIILAFLLISCSGDSEKDSKLDIFDGRYDSSIFSINSFKNIGFKISKEYDVSELPDAIEAHYGFWAEDSFERLSYELRFYPSNEIAISSGTFYAEEATGEDAIIKKSDATWKEGIKDRMTSGAFGNKKNTPKYLDYVILGNMIVLCPIEISSSEIGASDPMENCRNMLSKLSID